MNVSRTTVCGNPGEGSYIWDQNGKRYLDGTAGLWFANLGYGRPEIAAAVAAQMNEIFAYHNFTDYVTQPTIDLANRIARHAPDPGSKVFFTSGGSDAVDSAAKLVRRYHMLTGNPERTVHRQGVGLSRMHTYGTFAAGIEPNRTGYGELVPRCRPGSHDERRRHRESTRSHDGAERIAGIFCEPVIGAGGVPAVRFDYLHTARDLVREAGRAVYFDEVITGFGRIGDWFAAVRFDLDPDLILFARG